MPEMTLEWILKENGINQEAFNRTRNKLVGEYIRQFNSVDKISHMFMAWN